VAADTAFTQALETVLAREVDGYRALADCRQLTAGASQETYRIQCETDEGDTSFALRRAVPTLQNTTSEVGSISLATEALLFQLAAENAIPAPRVLYVLSEADGLGDGFLMEWLEGETLGQRIVKVDELAEVRPRLARQCGEILGRIHTIDWQAAGLSEHVPTVSPETLVDETYAAYRELDVPAPMIDYAWRWLKDNVPTDYRTTLVHGDFRNGNLMVNADGVNAVLDWELAQIGDPVRDLGWLCVNSWRFGFSDKPVGGFGDVDELLAGYASTSGVEVDPQAILFWQVFGSFWWAMATLQMANSWRRGKTPSLERPVIGRRSSEAQMDCVNLLIPGPFALPDADRPLDAGTQLPMPAELLSGVRDFLKETAAGQLDPHNGFLARVAANSLGIAQREFVHGGTLAAAEKSRLETLLEKSGDLDALRWELATRLRDGLALDTPGLADHLRQTVAAQCWIDQPRYSALAGG
jgi:aminoglycoside phosphotransferase (APT) family kinase protein